MKLGWLILLAPACWGQPQIKPLIDLPGTSGEGQLSPDGKTLAFAYCDPEYKACGIYARPWEGGPARMLTKPVEDITQEGTPGSPRWSPDGKRIALARFVSRFETKLSLLDPSKGTEQGLGGLCEGASFDWSPDGKYLAASVYTEDPPKSFRCRTALVSLANGSRRPLIEGADSPAFSPDGRFLAYADQFLLKVVPLLKNYQLAGPARILAREPRPISQVLWAPDGRQIVYQAWGDVPYLRIVSLDAGARPPLIPGTPNGLSLYQILSNGDALGEDSFSPATHWRVDLKSSNPKAEPHSSAPCSEGAPDCSPDGRLRAFFSTDTGISQLWVTNADGTNRRLILRATPPMGDPADYSYPESLVWSHDSRFLAFTIRSHIGNADTRSHLYVIPAEGGAARRLGKEVHSLSQPAWTKDDRNLICLAQKPIDGKAADPGSNLAVVAVSTGQTSPIDAAGTAPRLSTDGKWLYFIKFPYPRLMRLPLPGGRAELLLDDRTLDFPYAVGSQFLYLFRGRDSQAQLTRFSPETKKSEIIANVPEPYRNASLSADERYLYFDNRQGSTGKVLLIREFLPH